MKIEVKYGMGDTLSVPVMGVKGVVRAIDIWNTGCVRYALQRPAGKDNKVPELVWVDEIEARLVKKGPSQTHKPTGGPHNNPGKSNFK